MKNSSQTLISIIIPAYNAERTIFRTLDSIYKSGFPKDQLEVILVDNNSSDETNLIAERFPIKVIHEGRQGRSIARNTGSKQAQGDYLFFLDADVYVEPGYFEEILKVLKRTGIGAVQGMIIPSDVDGQEGINQYRYRTIGEGTSETFCLMNLMVRESPMINSAACAYRREAFELVGGFDEALERHEDIDLARRVSYGGYTLASAEKARAHVIYHGEGWPSYFMRSFADGYTKIDYNRKWSLPQEWQGMEGDDEYLTQHEFDNGAEVEVSIPDFLKKEKVKSKKKEKFNRLNYVWWALRDLTLALVGFLKTFESFYLLLFINHSFKLTGRVLGPLRKPRHFGELIIPMAAADIRLKKITLKNGQKYFLKSTLRFVLLRRSLYVIDMNGHKILSGDSTMPNFFSYATFHHLGLFEEFKGDKDEDMIFQLLKYMELLQ